MGSLPGRLESLTAQDVMTRQIIVLLDTDTLENAVQTLKENRISGAPVTDARGMLVGILSVTDLVGSSGVGVSSPTGPTPLAQGHDDTTTWDLFERANAMEAQAGTQHVQQRMSRQIASVTVDAPLVEVARLMCDGHWHRIPVVDENGGLCGIIATMDILAALVNAFDERE